MRINRAYNFESTRRFFFTFFNLKSKPYGVLMDYQNLIFLTKRYSAYVSKGCFMAFRPPPNTKIFGLPPNSSFLKKNRLILGGCLTSLMVYPPIISQKSYTVEMSLSSLPSVVKDYPALCMYHPCTVLSCRGTLNLLSFISTA